MTESSGYKIPDDWLFDCSAICKLIRVLWPKSQSVCGNSQAKDRQLVRFTVNIDHLRYSHIHSQVKPIFITEIVKIYFTFPPLIKGTGAPVAPMGLLVLLSTHEAKFVIFPRKTIISL